MSSTTAFVPIGEQQIPAGAASQKLGVMGWGEFVTGQNDLLAIGVDAHGSTKWKMEMHVDNVGRTIALTGYGGYAGFVASNGYVTPSHAPSTLDKQMAQAMIADINCWNSGNCPPSRPGGGPYPASARHTLGTRAGCYTAVGIAVANLLVAPETGGISLVIDAYDLGDLIGECNLGTPYAGQDLPSTGGGGGGSGGGPSTPANCYVDGIQVPCTNVN